MPRSEQDVRNNPKAGDILLIARSFTREVLARKKSRIGEPMVEWKTNGATFTATLKRWRRINKNFSEVAHVAD